MEDRFHIDVRDPMPIYAQLERAIRFAIATQKLRIGEQLPTVRQLAVELKINANTVARVYAELERAGVLETRRGVGTFVCEPARVATARVPKAVRREQLRSLTDRIVGEAHTLNLPLEDVIEALQQALEER